MITVQELRALLKECDPDAQVFISCDETGSSFAPLGEDLTGARVVRQSPVVKFYDSDSVDDSIILWPTVWRPN